MQDSVSALISIVLLSTTCIGQDATPLNPKIGENLATFAPKDANTVESWNVARITANAHYSPIAIRNWYWLTKLTDLPLSRIKRLTKFRKYEGDRSPFGDDLWIIETVDSLPVDSVTATIKAHAGEDVTYQSKVIGTARIFSSTIATQGRNDPWLSFSFPNSHTILLETRGDKWLNEVLQRPSVSSQTRLQMSLAGTTDLDVVTVLMDLRELSALDKPMFAVFHGNGPYPESLGSPQLLLLRISDGPKLTAHLAVDCKGPDEAVGLVTLLRSLKTQEQQERVTEEPKHPLLVFTETCANVMNHNVVHIGVVGARVDIDLSFEHADVVKSLNESVPETAQLDQLRTK